MSHAEFAKLVDLVEDRLPPPELKKVQGHLDQGCASCKESKAWIEKIQDRMGTDTTPDPPEWLIRRSMTMFARMPALMKTTDHARIVASLVFDNFGSSPVGHRSTGPGTVRSQLFRAGSFDIDIQFRRERSDGVIRARGQILARGSEEAPESMSVELFDADGLVLTTKSDGFGEFDLGDVPPTPVDLHIHAEKDQEILVAGIDPTLPEFPHTN